MKRLAYLALLAAMAVLAFASIGTAQSAQEQGVQAVPNQSTEVVYIRDRGFKPDSLPVADGTTVTWVNEDTESHTVTADDRSFDSAELRPGESYSVRFDGTGTLWYHCAIHPEMQGSVSIGGDSVAQPSTAGEPAPDSEQPAGETTRPTSSGTTQPTEETTQTTNDATGV